MASAQKNDEKTKQPCTTKSECENERKRRLHKNGIRTAVKKQNKAYAHFHMFEKKKNYTHNFRWREIVFDSGQAND